MSPLRRGAPGPPRCLAEASLAAEAARRGRGGARSCDEFAGEPGSRALTELSERNQEIESMPARIVVTEFVSLDGVMEAPGGEPFKYPGWTFEFDRGEDGNQFQLDATRQADALLIGRRTYESFAGAWPQREGEFADKFNAMPKFVVSTTLTDPEWNNTTVLGSGDATAQVRKLKEEFDGELQIPGSHRLVQELIASDLVDQINLMVFPVILGTGKKAFEEQADRRRLRLKESKVVGEGIAVLIYERADAE
jgi:dihydrofolate reductase